MPIHIGFAVFWVFLMFKAYKGEKYPMIILISSAARSPINRLYAGIALLRPVGIALRSRRTRSALIQPHCRPPPSPDPPHLQDPPANH
jgi:hypothetical protein